MGHFEEKFQTAPTAFNFEDVILLPGLASVEPKDIDIKTRFSDGITLNTPIVSSPMDTVTEANMAIALARQGSMGVVHRNCSAEEELAMIKSVKRSESFIIRDVVTIDEGKTVKEAREIMRDNSISGLAVVKDKRLSGIITNRDVRFTDPETLVRDAMTTDMVTTHEGINEQDAISLMRKNKVEKLPVVDKAGNLTGLITYKDVMLRDKYGNATRDGNGRLRVAAGVSPFDMDRAKMLAKYADALVIDVAHFHNENVIAATKRMIDSVSIDVVIGSLGTKADVIDSVTRIDAAAGLRMGIGSGSICITTNVTKAGAPTLFAVSQAADALAEVGSHIPIIADGGIRGPGDVALALAFGADLAMMGYAFAGCKESPSEVTVIDEKYYKIHRGMGSQAAREKRLALDRYAKLSKGIPEGIEMLVPYKGEVENTLDEFSSGIKAAMGYAGASSIMEMHGNARIAKAMVRAKGGGNAGTPKQQVT